MICESARLLWALVAKILLQNYTDKTQRRNISPVDIAKASDNWTSCITVQKD